MNSLPFAWDVTQKLSPFWASNKDIILDSVFGHVVIDGEVWYMYVDWHDLYHEGQNKARVLRHKGPDLDHLERQPDGVANLGGYHGGGFLGVGMWWDDKERILYSLIHTEITPPTDRVITVTLKEGTTPSRYFPPHDSYSYEPHPESGDPIESRKTKIVGSTSPEVRYEGDGWTIEKNPQYFEGQANVAAKVDQNIQFTFQGPSIFWRAVANRDAGKADVFVDDKLQETVDCFFQECALPYQFAFIKTGLDPKHSHTIKIVTRADKNPESSGTKIRHIAFEYGLIDEQK